MEFFLNLNAYFKYRLVDTSIQLALAHVQFHTVGSVRPCEYKDLPRIPLIRHCLPLKINTDYNFPTDYYNRQGTRSLFS